MNLVIVHSHFRPSGVRRVIELATPSLIATWSPQIEQIVLVAGESPDDAWLERFRKGVGGVRVTCSIEPAAGYLSGQSTTVAVIARRLRAHLDLCLGAMDAGSCLVWAHNQGLGRNLLLTRALTEACAARDIRLLMHHHDWWFDNRWPRWPEMRRSGFRTLSAVARTLFPPLPNVRHAAINNTEAAVLKEHLGAASAWLPNPAGRFPEVSSARLRRTRNWLARRFGDRSPVWIVPCRLLRRKNLAEALLLTRWLRPEAWLATTAGVSSEAEAGYARALADAAREEGWRVQFGILSGEAAAPSVPELMAAGEAVLLTSLQEGFGLPYVEAAAAGRPLIARSLANVAPDLRRFGLHLAHAYDEVRVDPGLLDWPAEQRRQLRRFQKWRSALPGSVRRRVNPPSLLTGSGVPRGVPFSRLTLVAQLELLRQPVAQSWARCVPLNPFLERWRRQAASGSLTPERWPAKADRWLGGDAFSRRLGDLMNSEADSSHLTHAWRCQEQLLRDKLQPVYLYPLLWSTET